MEYLNQFIDQYKLPLSLSIIGLVLIIGGIASSKFLDKPRIYPKASLVNQNSFQQSSQIKVDISGAVKNPGIHNLGMDARVEDAIKAAGGFSENANSEFIAKNLNLSQKLSDGTKIYIPFEGDSAIFSKGAGGVSGGSIGMDRIGLNTASQSELESLPSVGSVTAGKIISARPYADTGELKTKRIVSAAVFNKIKDLIDLH